MDKFFKISERGSTISTEVIGGLTTFLAMAYIIAVNPSILSAAGVPFNAALTATCFGAALMTIAMGLFANRPIALASGMGINAVVAFGLCLGFGVDWRVAMAVIFLEGILILILVLCGLREAIMEAIPVSLQRAIAIGIGLFIAFIGLRNGGIVVSDEATSLALGSLTSPVVAVALISILTAVILTALKVKAGLLISIIFATLVGIPLGITALPTEYIFMPDFSTFGAPFQLTPDGIMGIAQIFIQPALLMFVFSLLMSDFFDTMGTVVAVGSQGDFVDKDNKIKNVKEILIVDSAAAAVGGLAGASSITSYIESISGVAAGARTGLSNMVIGAAFIIFAFLSPFVGMVTGAATCGALVVVGYLMMSDIAAIDWKDISLAFPAFITIIGIPLTYSITNGIGFGFISYVIIKLAQGKAKEVKPLMWVAALAFAITFIFLQ
ncbi:MAG: NCS2 family permease [Eggerthellaceae bacterium]|nr:NCS2 family permease [Eggerthellaceae bacterium]